MKVISIHDVPKEEFTNWPLFTGKITIQSAITEKDGADITAAYVHFTKGVRNKFHTHSNDQLLIVTHGKGYVVTEKEKIAVKVGDIIHIPKGEKHWHGARPGEKFTHISITRLGTKLTQLEK